MKKFFPKSKNLLFLIMEIKKITLLLYIKIQKMNMITKKDEILAKVVLEEAHLRYINENLESLYDKIGPLTDTEEATGLFLINEKTDTISRIRELKQEYNKAMFEESTTCTGKIEIEYTNIPDEVRFKLYRFLNSLSFEYSGLNYKTVSNETKYSKDWPSQEN